MEFWVDLKQLQHYNRAGESGLTTLNCGNDSEMDC